MDGGGRLVRSVTRALFGASAPRPRPGDINVPLLMGERGGRLSALRFWRRASVTLPLHERLPKRFGAALAVGGLALVGVAGLGVGGHLQEWRETNGELHHVLARAVGSASTASRSPASRSFTRSRCCRPPASIPKTSLAFFDAAEAREKLAAHPLIGEASVRKLYPGEITIQVVERDAFALWQLNGEISIIAADGTVIDRMRDGRFAHLPLVVGPDANKRVRDYVALLEEAGPLRPRIRGATLVSGRRWTLKLDNGLDVRLPEEGRTPLCAGSNGCRASRS